MYKWLKMYLATFGKDFPFSAVADKNEYEICRIIQYCVNTRTAYSETAAADALAGSAVVDKTKVK